MGHKCYISFKAEDIEYKQQIQEWSEDNKIDLIDKSLDTPVDSDNEDYIMSQIRDNYLSDSTVTIFLIGKYSSEKLGTCENKFIKRELQASLFNGQNNSRNGILGVVLPDMYEQIFKGTYICRQCNNEHNIVKIDDDSVIREFSRNYYLDNIHQCHYKEEDRYCVLVRWEDFKSAPNKYIEKAFKKRTEPIANKVIVRPSQ